MRLKQKAPSVALVVRSLSYIAYTTANLCSGAGTRGVTCFRRAKKTVVKAFDFVNTAKRVGPYDHCNKRCFIFSVRPVQETVLRILYRLQTLWHFESAPLGAGDEDSDCVRLSAVATCGCMRQPADDLKAQSCNQHTLSSYSVPLLPSALSQA